MRKLYFFLIPVLILVVSCQQEHHLRADVVQKLKLSARVSTTEFVVSKVIMSKKQRSFLGINLGKEASFMARTKAHIKVGIDLDKLQKEDILIEGNKISLNLPAVEMTNFSYPAEEFQFIDKYSDEGIWNFFTVENKDYIFRHAESEIRASLDELGLKSVAEKNTRLFFENLLLNFGFSEVYIQFKNVKN